MVKRIGQYQLEDKIGEGNYGSVFTGINVNTNEKVAAKSVPIRNLNSKLVQQMEREIKVLKDLDSPYIIKLFEVLKTSNNVYLIMEYCSGGDLEKRMRVSGRIEEERAKKWLSQLIEAFITLQEHSIMHRDLKLANVLLTDSDDIKLADFGFARFLNENAVAVTQLGTPMYMAPEIFNSETYSYKADVWSLGVLTYEILVGKPAFDCKTLPKLKELQKHEINVPDIGLSHDAIHFIKAMMTYDHNERPGFSQLREHPFLYTRTLPKSPENNPNEEYLFEISDEDSAKNSESANTNQVNISHIENILGLQDTVTQRGNKYAAFCIALYTKKMLNEYFEKNMSARMSVNDRIQNGFFTAEDLLRRLGNELGISEEPSNDQIQMLTTELVNYCRMLMKFNESIRQCMDLLLVAIELDPNNEASIAMYIECSQIVNKISKNSQ